MELTVTKLAQMIDHTELKPDATEERIRSLCSEAVAHKFGAVCVNSHNVAIAAEALKGTEVKVCSVIGFPLGAMITDAKVCETRAAVKNGAAEIDMVLNIGAFKSGDFEAVRSDIAAVVEGASGHTVKVILETGYLTTDEIVQACKICEDAGAHFVKTSTGFGPRGASVDDVKIMHETVGGRLGIKAAGGIRTFEDALAMISAGATRIGASKGIQILAGFHE
ncbi:MAG: deoxyribose-phosphate aldolase [Candidatus Thorarchaeota archaeon]|nr:deoxyribose-phosphate aldolase [Candidatus Thorarchaeota archaeon]